jgi:hypothetical protein
VSTLSPESITRLIGLGDALVSVMLALNAHHQRPCPCEPCTLARTWLLERQQPGSTVAGASSAVP